MLVRDVPKGKVLQGLENHPGAGRDFATSPSLKKVGELRTLQEAP